MEERVCAWVGWVTGLVLCLWGALAVAAQPTVAVMDFQSIGSEEHLGNAVAEIMRTELVGSKKFRIVERSQIDKAVKEQALRMSGMMSDDSAVAIGKLLGADFIVVGSVVKIGNAYTINSRMIQVTSGEVTLGRNVSGNDLDLLTTMSRDLIGELFGSSKEGKDQMVRQPAKGVEARPTAPSVPVSYGDTIWRLGRSDGSVIADRVVLLSDGRIDGYSHPNESRWGYENGTVVFYHQSGQPSCRFSETRQVDGKLILSGPFLFQPGITHVLTALGPAVAVKGSVRDLEKRTWKFGRGDGVVIAGAIRLRPGGRIEGYSHPNESRWGLEGDTVVFYNEAGQVTSRFATVEKIGEALVLSGPFLPNPAITHVLTESQ